ncbi:MAG: DUF2490 domain-containing protein [Chitinophagaceae bacterium]|nr:DUF2490 domain-containing protein [Chitinophagaceae bacterium]
MLGTLLVSGQVVTRSQAWFTYQAQARVSTKWSLWFDANYRSQRSFLQENFQDAIRVGITRHVTEKASWSAGYAFFRLYRPKPGPDDKLEEHRLWAQYFWVKSTGNWQLSHRIRAEQRNQELTPIPVRDRDDVFNTVRLRYMFTGRYPLQQTKTTKLPLWLQLADEIMVHTGKGVGLRIFEQNRVVAGLEAGLGHSLFLSASYMHLLQYQPLAERWRQSHVVRLTLRHQLDWRRS